MWFTLGHRLCLNLPILIGAQFRNYGLRIHKDFADKIRSRSLYE